ncbi:hypothetical protein JRQ81_019494, partial [Phrynocephalus forsythii]
MQSSTASGVLPVPRLGESNFLAWTFKMQMYLKCESLWKCVENPRAVDDDKFHELNKKALATIVLSLQDSQLNYIHSISSAKDCWEALRNVHVRQTACSRMLLTRKLYRKRLNEGDSVSEHLSFMRQIFVELEEA